MRILTSFPSPDSQNCPGQAMEGNSFVFLFEHFLLSGGRASIPVPDTPDKCVVRGDFGCPGQKKIHFSRKLIFSPSWNEYREVFPACEHALDILDFL
jgi:hypothetical protein